MGPLQRQESILRLVEMNDVVRTASLVRQFGVTEETIRKDLELLAAAKRLIRTHGGAVIRVPSSQRDLPLPARQNMNRLEKAAVAAEAVKLIKPHDTVFLDGSSTALRMTEFLPRIPLTILTNAHHVIVGLGDRMDCDLICTGGNYENRSRSYVGQMAEESLRRFVIRWLFLGVDGLHSELGASEVNPGQAVLKQRLIQRAENVVIVCDSTKLEQKSPFLFAEVGDIDILVTDALARQESTRKLEARGVRIIMAPFPPAQNTPALPSCAADGQDREAALATLPLKAVEPVAM